MPLLGQRVVDLPGRIEDADLGIVAHEADVVRQRLGNDQIVVGQIDEKLAFRMAEGTEEVRQPLVFLLAEIADRQPFGDEALNDLRRLVGRAVVRNDDLVGEVEGFRDLPDMREQVPQKVGAVVGRHADAEDDVGGRVVVGALPDGGQLLGIDGDVHGA